MKNQTKPAVSAKESAKISPQKARSEQESFPLPIVGIGSSAGGLEALELFLQRVPNNSGTARGEGKINGSA